MQMFYVSAIAATPYGQLGLFADGTIHAHNAASEELEDGNFYYVYALSAANPGVYRFMMDYFFTSEREPE